MSRQSAWRGDNADADVAGAGFDESFKRGSAVYTFEDSEEQRFAKLAVLECRGCELTEFDTKVSEQRMSMPSLS